MQLSANKHMDLDFGSYTVKVILPTPTPPNHYRINPVIEKNISENLKVSFLNKRDEKTFQKRSFHPPLTTQKLTKNTKILT